MTEKTQQLTVNGVDVPRLKEMVQAVGTDPGLARFQFRLRNRWLGVGSNRSEIGRFSGTDQEHRTDGEAFIVDNDEPEVLLGQDRAPNPVEYVLHALAGCLTTTMVYHAAARGIEIQSVECELTGEIDLRGFLGLSDEVPKGYQKIEAKFRVKSDAPLETLQELAPDYRS